ncbi:MAG: AmmeMemoRadiSam system radical SAM enzyme [Ignavibacteria bacterium]|jgi:pyruvate formate lyase activating enzyme|nr:AmmeMemoRadiSam system radical SAM enzyme [Ignavibacteria bacterium]
MKEASFYISFKSGRAACVLCPHECSIPIGQTGTCGVRKNIDGKLYALTYSKPVAIHLDPIEKKPLYHFYPGSQILSIGTLGCNLSCKFCQNFDISQEFDEDDFNYMKEVTPDEIIGMCKSKGYKFVAFTYNEPTIFFEYMFDVAVRCKENDIKTVVVSNGQIQRGPLNRIIEYIDAFNIDLKSFNPAFYKDICGGEIEATIETIKIIIERGKHLEVTFLLIEGLNDNVKEFEEMCRFLSALNKDIVLHISRAFPRYEMDFNPTPEGLIFKFKKIAENYLNHVYAGNI